MRPGLDLSVLYRSCTVSHSGRLGSITGDHSKYPGRTYGTYKDLYISLIYNNIWSFLLWSPVIDDISWVE